MLVPIDQFKGTAQKQQSFGNLKPLAPKVRVAQPRPDVRQSQNYLNAVSTANKYQQEAERAGSLRGIATNIVKGLPRATYDIGKEAITHPINTTRSVAAGVYEGGIKPLAKLSTYLAGNSGREMRRGLDLIGEKMAGNQNQTQQGIREGFKFAGAVAPYELAGSVATKVLPNAPKLAGLAGYVGGGQITYEGDNNIKDRGKQALSDALLYGLTKLAGKGLDKLKKPIAEAVPYTAPAITPLPPKAAPQPQVVFRGRTAGVDESAAPYRLFSASQDRAKQYASLSEKPEVIQQNIAGLKLKKVPASKYLDAVEDPKVQAKYDGVTFKEPDGTEAHALFSKKASKVKESGLLNTIKNSPEYSQDMARNLDGAGGYVTRSQEPLVKEAQKTIINNISEAERIATTESSDRATIMADQLAKHYDSIAVEAKKTGDQATFDLAMQKAKSVALQADVNLRESGRAIAAANQFNKQSPEGMLRTLNQIATDSGVKLNLSNEKIFEFQRKAEALNMIPDAKQRALKTFELMDEVYDSVPSSAKDKLYQALNLPRAIMSTADLSAPLRQGIFTMARHPITFAKNFGNMFKYAFSEDAYRNLKADIVTSPNYELYVKNKLPLTDLSRGLTAREENFMSNLAEKIPGFGKLAKGSNRAYSGFLNKMRVDLFDDFVKTGKLNGITDPKYLEDAARFVGSATGRGNINKFFGGEEGGKVWNSFFFSPRLMSSRLSLINPLYYVKLHPEVRKEALKSLAAFVGTGTGMLALAKMAGAEVGTDPRSADFGKIKVGNTRYDTWGGFQQYARLIGQLTTGEMVSTVTGKETQLGEGYNAPTRLDIIARFLQSKENPLASFATTALTGKTMLGDNANIPAEVIDRFIPMLAQDASDLMKEYGVAQGAAMAIPGIFGIGSQTYGAQVPMTATTANGNPTIQWRQQPNLGEQLLNAATGTEISTIPPEQQKALAEERLNEQKRQIEVNKAKALVLATGETQYVGDTKVYLENGIVKTKKESKDKRTPLKDQLLYNEVKKRASESKPFFTP